VAALQASEQRAGRSAAQGSWHAAINEVLLEHEFAVAEKLRSVPIVVRVIGTIELPVVCRGRTHDAVVALSNGVVTCNTTGQARLGGRPGRRGADRGPAHRAGAARCAVTS